MDCKHVVDGVVLSGEPGVCAWCRIEELEAERDELRRRVEEMDLSRAPTPSSSDLFVTRGAARTVWSQLPRKRQRGWSKFASAFAQALVEGTRAHVIAKGLLEYYESPDGQGDFARLPARFVADRGWLEDREAWGCKSQAQLDAEQRAREFIKRREAGSYTKGGNLYGR